MLAPPNLTELQEVATTFRCRLDAAEPSTLGDAWLYFPAGSCGAASEVLAEVLHRRFGVPITCVCGEMDEPRWSSHAWLEISGILIDVTADQFDQSPVIVAEQSRWHERLRDVQRRPYVTDEGWLSAYAARVWPLVSDLVAA